MVDYSEKNNGAPLVSIKNGYDIGMSQLLSADLIPLKGGYISSSVGLYLQNNTGSDITYTLNSDVEFILKDQKDIVVFVEKAEDVKVKGTGTITYIINSYEA